MRVFNVTGTCNPGRHYMVDVGKKLEKIKAMVDKGQYFTINRARQYGKTTTLHLLEKVLAPAYLCIRISFEGVGGSMFLSEENFCKQFLVFMAERVKYQQEGLEALWLNDEVDSFIKLDRHLNRICEGQKIVLMIDETDKTSNNTIFLYFIGMLRNKYLDRDAAGVNTFHSVILAGVYDIKNIKLKLKNEGNYNEKEAGSVLNSPWNIAADFNVDMSFDADEIAFMLKNYERDHQIGMDIMGVAAEIYDFTSGYPFLVSRICKCIDEELEKNWSKQGVTEAVRVIVSGTNLLFDDIIKNLVNNEHVSTIMRTLLMKGSLSGMSIHNPHVNMCIMYGYLKVDKFSNIEIANKMFAKVMLSYFMSLEWLAAEQLRVCGGEAEDIVADGKLNMEAVLTKFAKFYGELVTDRDFNFLEKDGRLIFLMYLNPIINGGGFFHIESQLTDLRRMDIVVDYGQEQFIIELKIWRGEGARDKAYAQLLGYMNAKGRDVGYLLTFDFRKEGTRKKKAEWVQIGDKKILDVIV